MTWSGYVKWALRTLGCVLLCGVASWGQAGEVVARVPGLPQGLYYIGFDAQKPGWVVYLVGEEGRVDRISTQIEPRSICILPDLTKGVYAGADGNIRIIDVRSGSEKVVAEGRSDLSVVQPCWIDASGNGIVQVEMMDGKSVETEIVGIDLRTGVRRHLARQPGAQFEPQIHEGRLLAYSSVACSEGCIDLLQEIWWRDLLTGEARQLTLLNAISHTPVWHGRSIVFSSNASGSYQLWQVSVAGGEPVRLTWSGTNDVSPASCGGNIFFLRSQPGGTYLMKTTSAGEIKFNTVPGSGAMRGLRCVY